ncbi:MAG TPA: glutaredoxin family protein [Chloroflexota bacterium]|nr:glutaredoxin family protein [Chloroflexota bacterium]
MRLVLYSKPGCHLCESVRADLVRLGADFEERDITRDDALFRRYQYLIPVLESADGRFLEAPITAEDVANFVLAT